MLVISKPFVLAQIRKQIWKAQGLVRISYANVQIHLLYFTTLFNPHVVAALDPYGGQPLVLMWLRPSVHILSGVMWPCHLVARITTQTAILFIYGCNPPTPLTVLLYTRGRFCESPPFAWLSCLVSSPPCTIERIYRSVSVYLLHAYVSVPPSPSSLKMSLNIQGDSFKP
jgi:hypothetical protein